MQIIAIVSEKGGVGKTTLSILTAVTACHDIEDAIVLIDADYKPRATAWSTHRKHDKRIVVVRAATAETMDRVLGRARDREVRLCLIDTPATRTPLSDRAIEVADLVVVPAKAGALECWELSETLQLVLDAGKPFVCVLMDVPGRREGRDGPDVRAARGALAHLGPRLWEGQITHRAAIRRVHGWSVADPDEQPDEIKAVAAELSAFWAFLKAAVGGRP